MKSSRTLDAGIYTCKARNKYGEAVSTCKVTIKKQEKVDGSFRPEALPKIKELEDKNVPEIDEKPVDFEPPMFLENLNNQEINEGETAVFTTRLVGGVLLLF